MAPLGRAAMHQEPRGWVRQVAPVAADHPLNAVRSGGL